jgi:hypothetical protein
MVPLFSDWKRDGQAVARRRKWTRGIRRVRAGRILQMVEIEEQLAGLI